MTVRMLVEGHSDPAERQAGRRQHPHVRRLHRHLKEEYGVQTRFQLGYAMGQHERNDEPGDDESS